MNNIIPTKPTTLTLITTNHCTSACYNCCFQCSPKKKDKLSIKDMKYYIDQVKREYPSVCLLVLTGGECFTYKEELSEVINYASSKHNLYCRIISNAFWANTYDNAKKCLMPYIKAGLNEINFSTGDEHLEFVPFEYIKNACIASVELGLTPIINIESQKDKIFTSKDFLKDEKMAKLYIENKLKITNGIWVSFKKKKQYSTNSPQYLMCDHTRCENLFSAINIDSHHRMLACCGIAVKYIKYLDLGNLKTHSIKKLFENQFYDFIKIWLYVEGPHEILHFIAKYTNIKIEKYDSLHDCQVCAIILNNEFLLNILRKKYKEVYTNIILKYNALNY